MEFEFYSAFVIILLSALVPGISIAVPLLRKTKLTPWETLFFALILGLVLPPSVAFLLNIAGIKFSLVLTVASIAIVAAGGLGWGIRDGSFAEFFGEIRKSELKAQWPIIAVAIIALLAFTIRIQSLGPTFHEFDPYYYMYIGRQLIVLGEVPLVDNTAWYPYQTSHGNTLLTGYLGAGWFEMYTAGGAYDNYLLSTITNFYPPLVAALICFLVYMLFKEEYGEYVGILAAGLAAFTTRLIEKLAAGEAEIMPWGLFSTFFFICAFGLAIKRKDRRLAVLAGIAFMGTVYGSAYTMVITLIMAGYIGFEVFMRFIRDDELRPVLEASAIVWVFAVFSFVTNHIIYYHLYEVYFLGLKTEFYILTLVVMFTALLTYGPRYVKIRSRSDKLALAGVVAVLGIALLLTPFGSSLTGFVQNAVGFSKPSNELMQTVAEEAPLSCAGFTGSTRAFNFMGVLAEKGVCVNYAAGAQVYVPFLHVLCLAGLAYGVYRRNSGLCVLLIIAIFPISFVGLQKSKYVLQFGYMLVLAVAALVGEAYLLVSGWIEKDEDKRIVTQATAVVAAALIFMNAVAYPDIVGDQFAVLQGPAAEVLPGAILGSHDCAQIATAISKGENRYLSYYLYCSKVPDYWINAMNFIKEETPEDSTIVSWWDYGHWTNFFGDRPTLTRNEHQNINLDLMVADNFVDNTPEELAQFLRDYHGEYVMFDVDLISKWGALNYLSCVYMNRTNYSSGPGSSECERMNAFEYVYVPVKPQTNSQFSEYCDVGGKPVPIGYSSFGGYYCLLQDSSGQYVMVDPRNATVDGVLDLNKAKPNRGDMIAPSGTWSGGREFVSYLVWYPEVWRDGQPGLPDRKGDAYDSNFYRGFFLGKLPGFELVYPENDTFNGPVSPVRIFKLLQE